jgi:hypothetical protein
MRNSGILVYKCRRCGDLDKYIHVPDIPIALICCEMGQEFPWTGGVGVPKLTDIHNCEDGGFGVSDLMGGEKD